MTERVERWGRGLASLALLVGLVVGVPAALLVLGGDPLPRRWDLGAVWAALLRPDDGAVLARLLTLVGWLAWIVFTLSLLVELVNLLRTRSGNVVLPGLGGVQQWAAGLMLGVVALGGATQLLAGPTPTATVSRAAPEVDRAAPPATSSSFAAPSAPDLGPEHRAAPAGGAAGPAPADPVPADPVPAEHLPTDPVPTDPVPTERGRNVPVTAPSGRGERVHVVESGDDLWSLAEHYYGRGQDWRRIAAANPDRLTGGPDRLRVGWRLVVPDARAARTSDEDDAGSPVQVRRGDTLSSVAARALGDADRWPELYRANRDQLSDPDDLPVGLSLRVPSDGRGGADPAASDVRRAGRKAEPPVSRPSTTAPASPPPTAGSGIPAPSTPSNPAPTLPAPTPPASTPGASSAASGEGAAPASPSTDAAGPSLLVPGLATVGGLLAAALMGGLAARRRWQLQQRPLGRRIAHPPAATRTVEVALARRAARPIGLRTLDRASRALAASCVEAGVAVPALRSASVSPDWLVLEMVAPTPPAPRCFVDTGATWALSADEVDGLRSVRGIGEAVRPWPLLVTLGADPEGAELVVDLESIGLLAVTGPPATGTSVLAAMALELACSPWTDELRLTLVGDERLAPALAQHNVQTVDDVDTLLDRLERVHRDRLVHARGMVARDLRLDPDLGDAWTPEVVLVDVALTPAQAQRLVALTTGRPGAAVTAVVRGQVEAATSTFELGDDGRATLLPDGVRVVPQTLPGEGLDPVLELVAATGSGETDPAPWWSSADPSQAPPDNVTYLGRRRRTDERDEQERRAAVQARITEAAAGGASHPLLQLLGPVEMLGAAGTPPARAAKQCLEYCAWLLEHPGTSAQEMAAGLLVAEGTRRSNMSRLRTWLGSDAQGEPYLPDAYSGRIRLDATVSSDWHQLRLLLGDGVDRAPTSVLELGLRLVRGVPLADAAPVQWHWAEELRTDIVSCVRDVGVELTRRALDDRDLDLARWSAARALVVAPGDELLLCARIRTEHLAGNAAETERLSLQLASQARTLGVDLEPESVDLIQEVMEGRVRARLA